ncbi:hypothetical protein GCM10022420_027350 [Streptomyces iranensis]
MGSGLISCRIRLPHCSRICALAAPDRIWTSLRYRPVAPYTGRRRTTFRAGDRILLKAGGSWKGQLWPKGSGERNRPIVIGGYGGDIGHRGVPRVRIQDNFTHDNGDGILLCQHR